MSRSTGAEHSTEGPSAGFTLIEVLVALAIVATVLASLGGLVASSARGSRSIQSREAVLQAARSVLNTVPEREQLQLGPAAGRVGDVRWNMNVVPFADMTEAAPKDAMWIPYVVAVSVKSKSGNALELATVRLHRRNGGNGATGSQSSQ